MVLGCVPFKIVSDSPTLHSRWLLLFKVMIISLWNLLQYHSIVRWAIQAQWAEPLVINELLYLAQMVLVFFYCYQISQVCKFYEIPTPSEVGPFGYYNLICWVRRISTVIPLGSINISLQATMLNYFEGPSWSWSYGYMTLQLPLQSVSIITDDVSSNRDQGEVYNIMWQCLSVICDRSVVSSTNKTDCHNKTKILLKVALNTINQTIYTGY